MTSMPPLTDFRRIQLLECIDAEADFSVADSELRVAREGALAAEDWAARG